MKESAAINELIEPAPGEKPPEVASGRVPHANRFSLADLLRYHDKEFVFNAYAVIANRQPETEELTRALDDLRSGRRTKSELVEQLVDTHPGVHIDGVNSPVIRKIRRLPVIGYSLRMFRAIARLPVLMQHQQQFEAFIVGQQQYLVEHFNNVQVAHEGTEEERQTVSDAIKTVMMLSDSLVELSGSFAEAENRLRNLEEQRASEVAELRSTLNTLSQALKNHQKQTTTSIQRIQEQREKSEGQISDALISLTEQLQKQEQHLDDVRKNHDSIAVAQREFLINEVRAIVEAERAAVEDLQAHLDRKNAENATVIDELKAELNQLRAAIEDFQAAALEK